MSDTNTTPNPRKAGEPAAAQAPAAPMIIDLGKQRRKAVRDLGRGQGRLLDRISDHLSTLTRSGDVSEAAQPVIILVRPKKKKRRMGWY